MENYHLTKEQQFNREDQQISKAMDNLEETKTKLREEILNLQLQNSILKNAIKEFWDAGFNFCSSKQGGIIKEGSYPDFNTFYDNYFETDLHPIFKNITDSIFPHEKTDL